MSKKFSYRDRLNFHSEKMRKGLAHGGRLNKRESFSAGFTHWHSDLKIYNDVKRQCDPDAFTRGEKARVKARNKAYDDFKW